MHRRTTPERHGFTYPISHVWIDPDRPEALCDLHPAWSSHHMAPVRYRRKDYGTTPTGSLATMARSELAAVLGRPIEGPVRMLTQIRRWGWLFNPITIYFVWDTDPGAGSNPTAVADRAKIRAHRAMAPPNPVGAIIEVTNTPWKERHRYPVAFSVDDRSSNQTNDESDNQQLTAEFDKELHVSPFLGMDYRYRLTVDTRDDLVVVSVDVLGDQSSVVLHTSLHLQRQPATREVLRESLRNSAFPTHRVSAGIHRQALALWAKRVPFHAHQARRTTPTTSCPRTAEEITP